MSNLILSHRQVRGLLKAGDILIPGSPGFPSFSQSGRICEVDTLLENMDSGDRNDLTMLLSVFALLPSFAVRSILFLVRNYKLFPKKIRPLLRTADIGMKGIFYSLYYSDKSIHTKIGYNTHIERPGKPEGDMPKDDVSSSVQSVFRKAKTAAADLRKLDLESRAKSIGRLREVILRRQDEILDAVQKDTGKCRTDALVSEIFATLDHLAFIEKNTVKALKDKKVPTPIALMGKKSKIYYEPMGVVLVISPWNYPFAMGILPISTAIAAGNSVVYKPSEFTPLTGLLESLFNESGFPRDLIQVVYGDGKVGAELIDRRPDKIFFTGSVATGKKIMKQASELLIPVELELGGKDPMIVFSDSNVERSSSGALWGAFTNLGQACTSVERLYLEGDNQPFKDALVRKARQLTQGDDPDGDKDLGKMTTEFQVKIIKEHVDDAVAKGATLLTGSEWDGQSRFIPPLILDNVTDDMKIAQEETFGPILPILTFKSEQEVIERANNSPYGLSASVWTSDMNRADRVTRQLVTGNVSVNNVMLTEGNAELPFGGVKESGFGRYKGIIGLQSFSNVKSVIFDKDSDKIEANWFPYTKKKFSLFKEVTEGLFTTGYSKFLQFLVKALLLENYSDKIGKKGRSS